MRGQRYWIKAGVMEHEGRVLSSHVVNKERWLHQEGQVLVTTGSIGTAITWAVQSPCHASLFLVLEALKEFKAPYVLRFHAIGWFEEAYESCLEAQRRMQDIMAGGDRHLTSRTYVKPSDLTSGNVPEVIRFSLRSAIVPEDYAVQCIYDESVRQFVVERVGPKSAIGRVWGTFTSSAPCRLDSGYSDTVSAAYAEVLHTGSPRYDQVIALLPIPGQKNHWVPYHRVVFPNRSVSGSPAVAIVSQIAEVDFRVL